MYIGVSGLGALLVLIGLSLLICISTTPYLQWVGIPVTITIVSMFCFLIGCWVIDDIRKPKRTELEKKFIYGYNN